MSHFPLYISRATPSCKVRNAFWVDDVSRLLSCKAWLSCICFEWRILSVLDNLRTKMAQIQPFQFEPEYSTDEEGDEPGE